MSASTYDSLQPVDPQVSIDDLRQAILTSRESHESIDPYHLAITISNAANSIKEDAIRIIVSQSGFRSDDVRLLWDAADRFLVGLPSLVDFHRQLSEFENRSGPQGLWNYSTRLEPWGTILVCLPANAVIPLGIILPAALAASGNQLVFAVSSGAREAGLFILETIQTAVSERIHCWKGGVREAVDGLAGVEPAVDALYYMGSSKQFAKITETCAKSGVTLIYEGEGRGVAIVDDALSPDDLLYAIRQILDAKAFCLGRMCSAPDVVLVPDTLFDVFVETYFNECLARPLGGRPEIVLDAAALETVRRLDSALGKAIPELDSEREAHPFFWIANLDDALNATELFCPGVILVSVSDIESCFRAVSRLRFRLQITLFARGATRLNDLICRTHFARYCSWMNPVNQDAMLPWGNYGCSGNSDVLDFYRKGLRRVLIESDEIREGKTPR